MRSKSTRPVGRRLVWVSLPSVAKCLSLSSEAVVALVKRGELPARLVGGSRWFIHSDILNAFAIGLRRDRKGAA